MAAVLIQIYFHEEHLKHLYPFAVPYFNDKLTIYFENSVIAEQVLKSTNSKMAVCSWRLRQKQKGYYIGRPRPITQEVLNSEYDILSFTKNTKYHTMLAYAQRSHKDFQPCFDKILSAIGKTRPREVKDPIYQNHFSARREIYQDYVKNWLIPAMEVIEKDGEIRELALRDSNYHNLSQQSAEHLKEKIGLSYYPMVPFLLERLFSVYHNVNRIRVTYNDQE